MRARVAVLGWVGHRKGPLGMAGGSGARLAARFAVAGRGADSEDSEPADLTNMVRKLVLDNHRSVGFCFYNKPIMLGRGDERNQFT